MILYFSGTGNSAHVARSIARLTSDDMLDMTERIRHADHTALNSERPWVVVTPTYAWRMPRIVTDWLSATPLTGNRAVYVVMTCGASIGNAAHYARRLCEGKQMDFKGCAPIVMPENYIAMYDAPEEPEAREIIERAQRPIEDAARAIAAGKPLPKPTVTAKDRVNSGMVNPIFYPALVHARKFYATDACVSCGQCARVCPLGNVQLADGRPVWGSSCTHCMACICRCLAHVIEYGSSSVGKPRYTCPVE